MTDELYKLIFNTSFNQHCQFTVHEVFNFSQTNAIHDLLILGEINCIVLYL